MEELQTKLFELKSLLYKTSEYKKVKELENKLLEEDLNLIIDFNKKIDDYNNAIKYGYFDESYTKELSIAKEKLYSSNTCKEYFEALNKMNELLHNVSEIIFSNIVPDLKIK